VREERQELRLVVPLNASDVSLFPARDHSPVLPEMHCSGLERVTNLQEGAVCTCIIMVDYEMDFNKFFVLLF
jgi:hypothetical protein